MLIGNRRWLIEKGNRERSALNSGSELWLVSVTNFGAANIIRRVVLGKFEHYAVDASDALVACNRARSRENRCRYWVGTRRTSRTMETHSEAGQDVSTLLERECSTPDLGTRIISRAVDRRQVA